MFKKISLFISVALPLSVSQSFAALEWVTFEDKDTENGRHVRAVLKDSKTSEQFILESAVQESYNSYVETLKSLPEKIGYPSEEKAETSFNNQNINRQTAKNLYHLYTLSYQGKEEEKTSSLGFVQLGRMPTLGYKEGTEENPTAHHEILKKWMEFGITKQINENEGFKGDNFERIENRGLAFILPLFNSGLLKEDKTSSIEACYKLVCKFTNLAKESEQEKDLLPIEKTLPHYVMSLFVPEDSNVDYFQEDGFSVDKNEGFGWFYPKGNIPQPRIMVTRIVK
jgi:hypothetical protein